MAERTFSAWSRAWLAAMAEAGYPNACLVSGDLGDDYAWHHDVGRFYAVAICGVEEDARDRAAWLAAYRAFVLVDRLRPPFIKPSPELARRASDRGVPVSSEQGHVAAVERLGVDGPGPDGKHPRCAAVRIERVVHDSVDHRSEMRREFDEQTAGRQLLSGEHSHGVGYLPPTEVAQVRDPHGVQHAFADGQPVATLTAAQLVVDEAVGPCERGGDRPDRAVPCRVGEPGCGPAAVGEAQLERIVAHGRTVPGEVGQ